MVDGITCKNDAIKKLNMNKNILSYKTNKELALMLDQFIKDTKKGLEQFELDHESNIEVNQNIMLLEEVSRRLKIEQREKFNDEQFNV